MDAIDKNRTLQPDRLAFIGVFGYSWFRVETPHEIRRRKLQRKTTRVDRSERVNAYKTNPFLSCAEVLLICEVEDSVGMLRVRGKRDLYIPSWGVTVNAYQGVTRRPVGH